MTSVQDSINALYFEAERNANDGKPMFAILHGAPADDPATTMLSGRPEDIYPVNFGVTSSPPESRQVEPRHADSPGADSHLVHTEIDARTDATTDADSGTDDHEDHDDGGQANGQKLLAARLDDLYALAEQEATAPEQPDVPPEQPDILADNAPDSLAGDSPDSSPAHSGREPVDNPAPVTALPEQPPAPPQMGLDTDLNISDIHDLVQQAWDDGDADDRDADDRDAVSGTVHDDGSPDQPPAMTKAPAMNLAPAKAGADHIEPGHIEPGHIEPDETGPADETDIKAAMVEIAAAVNQLDTPVPAHMHGLKEEIVEAIKAELRAAMHADIAPMVRRAVAEVLAETAAQELAAKKETVGKKVAAKKAPKKPARAKTPDIKAKGKTTTTKTTATKKTATGKPAKVRRTKSSGSGKT